MLIWDLNKKEIYDISLLDSLLPESVSIQAKNMIYDLEEFETIPNIFVFKRKNISKTFHFEIFTVSSARKSILIPGSLFWIDFHENETTFTPALSPQKSFWILTPSLLKNEEKVVDALLIENIIN